MTKIVTTVLFIAIMLVTTSCASQDITDKPEINKSISESEEVPEAPSFLTQ